MRPRTAAVLSLLVLGLGCRSAPAFDAHLPPEAVLLEAPTSVEATLHQGTLLVPVTLNGHGPFLFAVDSGSTTSIVDRAVAEKAGLPVARRVGTLHTETGLRDGDMPQAEIRELRVGDASYLGVGALVDDLSGFEAGEGRSMDGILGMPVLRDHVWTLDLRGRRVTVAPSGTAIPAADNPLNVIPVTIDSMLPHLDADVAGHRTHALLDTGQWVPVVLGPEDRKPLGEKLRVVGRRTSRVLGGPVRQDVARLDGIVAVGPLRCFNPHVALASSTRVGLGLFEGRTLVLDFARSRVVLAP